jgi:predicted transport protein
VKIDNSVHDEWINWMKEVHIPDVMSTGYFLENNIYKILIEDKDGVNYSIQYSCASMNDLLEYQEKHAPRLQEEHTERYKNKYVAFRTLLEHVS